MRLDDVKRAVTKAGSRTLRFVGLLAIGVAIGAVTTEMFPEPVAAAPHPCENEYCDHPFPLWFWQDDVCRFGWGTDCSYISSDECITTSCFDDPNTPDPDPEDD